MNDFDFFVGTWNVHHRRRTDFLDPDSAWEEFPGVTTAHRLFDGAAHLDQVDCPTKGFSGLTLRLYDPERHEWSLNWANSRHGTLEPPVVGRFAPDGRGEFFGDDHYRDTPVRVRFIWSGISDRTAHWEQAFSTDAGTTWLTNWTMAFTRRD